MAGTNDMMRQLAGLLALGFFLLAAPAPAAGQQFEDIGDYRIHYSAMNTRMLPPEVARAYGIQRSGTRAMINIAVLAKAESADELDTPVHARVEASASNLTGQRHDIELEEITDDGAVYYIGSFRIHNEETLSFTVRVQPEGSDPPAQEFEFRQKFFTD